MNRYATILLLVPLFLGLGPCRERMQRFDVEREHRIGTPTQAGLEVESEWWGLWELCSRRDRDCVGTVFCRDFETGQSYVIEAPVEVDPLYVFAGYCELGDPFCAPQTNLVCWAPFKMSRWFASGDFQGCEMWAPDECQR